MSRPDPLKYPPHLDRVAALIQGSECEVGQHEHNFITSIRDFSPNIFLSLSARAPQCRLSQGESMKSIMSGTFLGEPRGFHTEPG